MYLKVKGGIRLVRWSKWWIVSVWRGLVSGGCGEVDEVEFVVD